MSTIAAMATDRHQASSYPLRMPDALRERVQEAAAASGRSVHSELLWRLERTFEQDEGKEQDRSVAEWRMLTLDLKSALLMQRMESLAKERAAIERDFPSVLTEPASLEPSKEWQRWHDVLGNELDLNLELGRVLSELDKLRPLFPNEEVAANEAARKHAQDSARADGKTTRGSTMESRKRLRGG